MKLFEFENVCQPTSSIFYVTGGTVLHTVFFVALKSNETRKNR